MTAATGGKNRMIPLFKSEYSLKSILTLEPYQVQEARVKGSADSILDICKDHNIEKFVLIDDNMSGFPIAVANTNKAGLEFIFGWRATIQEKENLTKDTIIERYANSHNVIIFLKSMEHYGSLCRLYKEAHIDNKGLTEGLLKQRWCDGFKLAIPFYDSFIFNNSMTFQTCILDYDFFKPTFFLEDNDLPFDNIIREKITKEYAEYPSLETKTIYYKDRKDCDAFMVYKCIHNRTILNKPNLDHFGSREFCFESYLEKV